MPIDPWVEKSILETFLTSSNKAPPLNFLRDLIFDLGGGLFRTLRYPRRPNFSGNMKGRKLTWIQVMLPENEFLVKNSFLAQKL